MLKLQSLKGGLNHLPYKVEKFCNDNRAIAWLLSAVAECLHDCRIFSRLKD